MQNKLMLDLLTTSIEINRTGEYHAGFRYGADINGEETLAVDLFKGGVNYYHKIVSNNDDLIVATQDIDSAIKDKSYWKINYSDGYLHVDEVLPSETLATSKAFMIKQRYNIDVTITEVRNENL